MLEQINEVVSKIDGAVWGPPMLILLVGTGIFLTFRLKFIPIRNLGHALASVLSPEARKSGENGDVSAFAALMTTLAATIGTGNIIGVATAMVAGGPGALVWMWIAAFFGLSTKYTECLLAFKYREKNSLGEMAGGPMYTMKNGFKHKKLGLIMAAIFALFAAIASFGIGNLSQANSIALSVKETIGAPAKVTGIILTILTLLVVVGGIQSISKVASVIVPVMAVLYTIFGLAVIIINHQNLPAGLQQIFVMAVDPKAVGGGVLGTITVSVMNSVRYGVARGVFSNEAGLGSAAIAASASSTEDPVKQGYISETGVFFDTIVVCSITGLAIASSGMLGTVGADGKALTGVALTMAAFETAVGPVGKWLVSIGIILFAFSTIIGWEYQGEKSYEYLVHGNRKLILVYRIVYSLIVYVGATQPLELVWNFSDIMNALMAIPNLISLLALNRVAADETERYQKQLVQERKARRKARLA